MAFQKVRVAVKEAFRKVRPPGSDDPLLAQYNKLMPHDFATLIKKHGEEKVVSFIKDMESKRSTYGANTKPA